MATKGSALEKIISQTSNKKYLSDMFEAMESVAGITPVSIKKSTKKKMTKAGQVVSTYKILLNDGGTLIVEIMADGKLGAIYYNKTVIRNREESLSSGGAKAGTQIAKTSLANQKKMIRKQIDTSDIADIMDGGAGTSEVPSDKQKELKALSEEVKSLEAKLQELKTRETELSKTIGTQINE
jgi:hypothetical protein